MKVVIIGGGGGVGSSVAFNLMLTGAGDSDEYDIVLVDRKASMIASHAMDLDDIRGIGASGRIRQGTAADVRDADVVVLAAAVPQRLDTSRAEFFRENAHVIAEALNILAAARNEWTGVLLMMTNPTDPLVEWARRSTGISRYRLLGYALNDSVRLRAAIAKVLRVPVSGVSAYVLGEHGEGCVPIYSRITVHHASTHLTMQQRADVDDYVRNWYKRQVALDSGRSSTWTSGLGAARMINAMRRGEKALYPVSLALDGEFGLTNTAVCVPAILGRDGVHDIVQWPLTRAESSALAASAATVRMAADSMDDGGRG